MIPSLYDILQDADVDGGFLDTAMPKLAFTKDTGFEGWCEPSWTENKFKKHHSLDIVLGDKVETNNEWVVYYYLPPPLMEGCFGHVRLSENDWCNRRRFHVKIYKIARWKRAREQDPVDYYAHVCQVCYHYYNVVSNRKGFEAEYSLPDETSHVTNVREEKLLLAIFLPTRLTSTYIICLV